MEAVGEHGTSVHALDSILREGFRRSRNVWDWLGDGVYFWENNFSRAREWATEQHGSDGCVVRASIELRDCVDLTNRGWFQLMRDHADELRRRMDEAGIALPRQAGKNHAQDRLVVNYLVERLEAAGVGVACLRAVFSEGEPAFQSSGFYSQAHVQIAVRDLTLIRITDYWTEGRGWTKLGERGMLEKL